MANDEDKDKLLPVASEDGGSDLQELSADTIPEKIERHSQWLETRGDEGERAVLCSMDLVRVDFSHSKLVSADLSYSDLTEANLAGCDLSASDLDGAILAGANLQDAELTDANLRDVDLRNANLSRTNFQRADLARVKLSGATAKEANFDDAKFADADITGANFSEAQNLTTEQILSTRFNRTTRFPRIIRREIIDWFVDKIENPLSVRVAAQVGLILFMLGVVLAWLTASFYPGWLLGALSVSIIGSILLTIVSFGARSRASKSAFDIKKDE